MVKKRKNRRKNTYVSCVYTWYRGSVQAGPDKKPIIRQSGISFERQWPTANWAYPRNQLDTVVILSPPAREPAKLVPKKVVAAHVS